MLTLTGPGGVGKTRLALEVGAQMVDAFPDGVWFVELGSLDEGTLIGDTIASALRAQAGKPEATRRLAAASPTGDAPDPRQLRAPAGRSSRSPMRSCAAAPTCASSPPAAKPSAWPGESLHAGAVDVAARAERSRRGAARAPRRMRCRPPLPRSRAAVDARVRADRGERGGDRADLPRWTGSRWPSSSRPRGCAPCRRTRSPRGWITASGS